MGARNGAPCDDLCRRGPLGQPHRLICSSRCGEPMRGRERGGGEVSMSWGFSEASGETALDGLFTQNGVVYFAATGDAPGALYPSASPNVVAVGGTSLVRNPLPWRGSLGISKVRSCGVPKHDAGDGERTVERARDARRATGHKL